MLFNPFFHCSDLVPKFLPDGLYSAKIKPPLTVHSAIKRGTKEVKGIWFLFSSYFSVLPDKAREF